MERAAKRLWLVRFYPNDLETIYVMTDVEIDKAYEVARDIDDEEQAALLELQAACQQGGQHPVIFGTPGMGKTHIVDKIMDEVEAEDHDEEKIDGKCMHCYVFGKACKH